MSRYSVAAHAASDRKKWVLVTIAILLLIAIVVLIITTNCFTDWNKYCLFGHDYGDDGKCVRCGEQKDIDEDKDVDKNKEKATAYGGVLPHVTEENGIRLLSSPLKASADIPQTVKDNSYVLTAKIVPESADYKRVDWNISWKNPAAAWASGKTVTDYVTVTPESDGALTATVYCKKDFAEQILITVVSRDNPDVSATCTVDYVQKITGINFNMPSVTSTSTQITYTFDTTVYTIKSDLTLSVGSSMALTTSFKNKYYELIESLPVDATGFVYCDPTITLRNNVISLSRPSTAHGFLQFGDDSSVASSQCHFPDNALIACFVGYVGPDVDYEMDGDYSAFASAFSRAAQSVAGAHATFEITYKATYNGTTYSSGNSTIDVRFDGSSLRVAVTDVTLPVGSILF